MIDWLGSVLHNCVVHPLYPFLPSRWWEWLHKKSLAYWPEQEAKEDDHRA